VQVKLKLLWLLVSVVTVSLKELKTVILVSLSSTDVFATTSRVFLAVTPTVFSCPQTQVVLELDHALRREDVMVVDLAKLLNKKPLELSAESEEVDEQPLVDALQLVLANKQLYKNYYFHSSSLITFFQKKINK